MIFTALMLLLATAPAQPVPKATTAATAPVDRAAQLKAALQKAGISPAGVTRLTTDRPQLVAQVQASVQSINQVNAQLRQAALADPVDVNLIGSLLKKRDDVLAAFTKIRTNETILVLQDLSPADRKAYLRVVLQPSGKPAASPQAK